MALSPRSWENISWRKNWNAPLLGGILCGLFECEILTQPTMSFQVRHSLLPNFLHTISKRAAPAEGGSCEAIDEIVVGLAKIGRGTAEVLPFSDSITALCATIQVLAWESLDNRALINPSKKCLT
jgi:hypothetical protein